VVERVGAGVSKLEPGDEVAAMNALGPCGAFAEHALVHESWAAKKPKSLSHAQAAALPMIGMTAHLALEDLGQLGAGQTLLVHGGAGGVGSMAVQLAKHKGAHVAATASAKNLEVLRKSGVDQPIDYRAEKFESVVKDADMVLDTQGGEVQDRSWQTLKPGGILVSIAGPPDPTFAAEKKMNPLFRAVIAWMSRKTRANARKHRARYRFAIVDADGVRLARVLELAEKGILAPVLGKTYPLSQAKQAIGDVETGRATGKTLIQIGGQ
jgi:NADPH:quinone reductase-like Zn-dependent oxidoreductase